ncbi:MAG: hypothetical protein MZV70_44690 [Desulfobacterales bacterium]|nr:hypothetical protein [Desulfobacterales bacterium]
MNVQGYVAAGQRGQVPGGPRAHHGGPAPSRGAAAAICPHGCERCLHAAATWIEPLAIRDLQAACRRLRARPAARPTMPCAPSSAPRRWP